MDSQPHIRGGRLQERPPISQNISNRVIKKRFTEPTPRCCNKKDTVHKR